MRKYLMMIVFALVFGLSIWNVSTALAKEHGGEEGGKEHGGEAVTEHKHDESAAATIREAADALRATNPDLAARLDQIAAQEESE